MYLNGDEIVGALLLEPTDDKPGTPPPLRSKLPSWGRNWSCRGLKRLQHPHDHMETPEPEEQDEQFDAPGTPAPSSMTLIANGDLSQKTKRSWQRTEPQSPLTPTQVAPVHGSGHTSRRMRRCQTGGKDSSSSTTWVPRSSVNGRCRTCKKAKLWPSSYPRPNKKRAAGGTLCPSWLGLHEGISSLHHSRAARTLWGEAR